MKPTQSSPPPRWRFEHHSLDAYQVSLEALIKGMTIVETIPKGFGKLKDQLGRALQSQFTQTTEATSRRGADRLARYRSARAEAGEAAGVLEALDRLKVVDAKQVDEVQGLLWRVCAMLHRLAKLRR